jgi:hypothetical protein
MSIDWTLRTFGAIALLAFAWIGTGGIGAIAHPEGIESKPVPAGDPIDEASCNPRDPLSPCFYEPPHGIPAGELLLVEDFF